MWNCCMLCLGFCISFLLLGIVEKFGDCCNKDEFKSLILFVYNEYLWVYVREIVFYKNYYCFKCFLNIFISIKKNMSIYLCYFCMLEFLWKYKFIKILIIIFFY